MLKVDQQYLVCHSLRFLDGHALDLVALLYRIHDVLSTANLAEDRMLAVQPVGRDMGDEELAAVRVRTGIGHRQRTHLMKIWVAFGFIRKSIPRAAASTPHGIAALNHEVCDHAMENGPIVEPIAS